MDEVTQVSNLKSRKKDQVCRRKLVLKF